jgi:ABC-2 type transport system permease protein
MTARESASGAIYDLGYQGYDGPRLGRSAAITTLFWDSFRAAFGLGRSGRAKIIPWGLTVFMLIPAAVAAAIAALVPVGGASPFNYDNYLFGAAPLLSLFVAAQAPELVSKDQRHRVLALYFSHALARGDYALAKVAALAAALFVVCFLPLFVIFLGAVLAASDVAKAFGDQLENIPQIIGAPLIYAIPLAALGMAIAAWTPRRAYATGAIIAVFIVTAAVAGIIGETNRGTLGQWIPVTSPYVALDGARDLLVGARNLDAVGPRGLPLWIYGAETLAIAVVCIGAVLWRYRRLDP